MTAPSGEADASLLTLVQWLSPSFPTGGFAYSHGLEAAIAEGEVAGAGELAAWLDDVVRFGSGRADAILLCLALRSPPGDLSAIAETTAALAAGRQRWLEAAEMGAAFARTLATMGAEPAPPVPAPPEPSVPLPVAIGIAARGLSLSPERVAALYLQAFAGNLVSAACRLMPLGQGAAQAVLAGLQPAILTVAAIAAEAPLHRIGGAAFGADLAAIRHETLEGRLFRT